MTTRSRLWIASAAVPAVVLALWHRRGEPGPNRIVLPRLPSFDTTTVMIVVGIVITVGCLVGARQPVAAFAVLALTSAVAAITWPLLIDNPVAGPVLATTGQGNGIHRNDVLALVPAAAAVGFAAAAWRQARRRPQRVGL